MNTILDLPQKYGQVFIEVKSSNSFAARGVEPGMWMQPDDFKYELINIEKHPSQSAYIFYYKYKPKYE